MPFSSKEVPFIKCQSQEQYAGYYQTDLPRIVLRSTSVPGMRDGVSKRLDESSEEQDIRSCPIIDDRSNSASPTRRQPNPAGMMAFRGFFGQSTGNDDRILEWPPPEPRPIFSRPVMPNLGGFLGPRTTPLHNPNVWFFGPTANVQQVIFEDGPEVISDDDDGDDYEYVTAEPPPLLHAQSSGLHRTESDFSLDSGQLGGSELSSDSIPMRGRVELREADDTNAYETPPGVRSRSRDAQGVVNYRLGDDDGDEIFQTETPRVSTIAAADEIHTTVQIQQGSIQPPPRPIMFIVMDTNETGRDQDDQDFPTEQFQFALRQLLNHLNTLSDETHS